MLGRELDPDLAAVLSGDGFVLIRCADVAALLEAVVERRPVAVVIVLAANDHDLRLLQLVRRAAPEVRLILLARDGDLGLQRTLQAMRPYYYDVGSFDPAELREAVLSAVRPARNPRPRR